MITPEEIARIYDVPVEALYENWWLEYGVPKLTRALFLVAIHKQWEEYVKRFLEMPLR